MHNLCWHPLCSQQGCCCMMPLSVSLCSDDPVCFPCRWCLELADSVALASAVADCYVLFPQATCWCCLMVVWVSSTLALWVASVPSPGRPWRRCWQASPLGTMRRWPGHWQLLEHAGEGLEQVPARAGTVSGASGDCIWQDDLHHAVACMAALGVAWCTSKS